MDSEEIKSTIHAAQRHLDSATMKVAVARDDLKDMNSVLATIRSTVSDASKLIIEDMIERLNQNIRFAALVNEQLSSYYERL